MRHIRLTFYWTVGPETKHTQEWAQQPGLRIDHTHDGEEQGLEEHRVLLNQITLYTYQCASASA